MTPVRKFAAVFLLGACALSLPLCASAQQQPNDRARLAAQKHNAKLSHKTVKDQSRAAKKAIKKAQKQAKVRQKTS
jgi:hypothetical protein